MYGGGGHYDGGAGAGNTNSLFGGGGGGAGNANSLFGGGGFMPSQSTNAPESSGGGGGFPKTRNAQTLLPLTVKQIMDATQTSDDKSNYAVNGIEVSTVRLVGRMLNKLDRVTDVSFTLDDGTGRIQVIRWENDTTDTTEMADIKDGDYVIVNGGLKGFQGKRQVVAYSVRPVTNFNDVTHHFLHCIHVHLQLARSKPQMNANTVAMTPNQAFPRNGMTPNQVPLQASGNSTGSKLSEMVLAYLSGPAVINIDIGVTPDTIKRDLNLSEDLVNAALKDLLGEGTVYATIDDTHYKSVMNG